MQDIDFLNQVHLSFVLFCNTSISFFFSKNKNSLTSRVIFFSFFLLSFFFVIWKTLQWSRWRWFTTFISLSTFWFIGCGHRCQMVTSRFKYFWFRHFRWSNISLGCQTYWSNNITWNRTRIYYRRRYVFSKIMF